MSTKKKPQQAPTNSKLNFRPSGSTDTKAESKGTKPLPEPSSVKHVLLMMIQHACRKILFVNIYYRVIAYLAVIFLVSVVTDFIPAPKIPLGRKDNFFNQYFVKLGWGWTLLLTVPFVTLTSHVYCCGKRDKVIQHLARLVVATAFWLGWTNFFIYVETIYGRCNVKDSRLQSRSSCLSKGFFWQSIDISGHSFILIYSTLVLIEEARVINCWEGISDHIRDEQFSRITEDSSPRSNPLRNLSLENFEAMRCSYIQHTPYIRSLFILITLLTLLWDCMLLGTILFYHNMIEKLLAGLSAVITWYFTYYIWFPSPNTLPNLPGDGCFKYRDLIKGQVPLTKRRTNNKASGPAFMGMPLRVNEDKQTSSPNDVSEDSTQWRREEGGSPSGKPTRTEEPNIRRSDRVRKLPDRFKSDNLS